MSLTKKQKELFDLLCGKHMEIPARKLKEAGDRLKWAKQNLKVASLLAGRAFREERESRGISLRKCARDMGISPTFLSDIERGRRMLPKEIWS